MERIVWIEAKLRAELNELPLEQGMTDWKSRAEQAIAAAAAALPLADTSDLTSLTDCMVQLEELSSLDGAPRALTGMAVRAAKLAEHIIMAETDFDTGIARLGEAVSKLTHAIEHAGGQDEVADEEATGAWGQEPENDAPVADVRNQAEQEIDDEVRDLVVKFASQQKPVLDDFEAYVLDWERGDASAKGAIKRILHTWKGEFGVLDQRDYSQLLHTVEEALEHDGIGTEGLFRLKDFLSRAIERFAEGKAPAISDKAVAAMFDAGNAGEDEAGDTTAEAAADVPTSGTRAFEGDPSLMGDFITESNDHIQSAESLFLELEHDPANTEYLNSIFRSCHTIKGVSGFLGLAEVSSLAHSMENVMDLARKGELALQPPHIDLLLEAMDCLKEMLASIEASIEEGEYRIPDSYRSIVERLGSPYEIGTADYAPAGNPDEKLGEILVKKGQATRDQVDAALHLQAGGDPRRLGEILIENGSVERREIAGALGSQSGARKSKTVEETIRVPVERLDQLVDAIGEAVIAQSMVFADPSITGAGNGALEKKVAQAALIMRQIQELSMSLRMISVRATFQKMARLVRDLSKKSKKDVEFITEGEDTELDKSVVENIGDPLIHMIRNAIDHGIEESAETRRTAGKPPKATVTLRAFHKAGNIYIEIEDDGRGLDRDKIMAKAVKQGLCGADDKFSDQEIFQFIFRPGFSTASAITDVSGRGVGMDVVKRNIEALRGSIEIHSEPGLGSRFSIRLPLTLAIIDGMIVRSGNDQYIVPTLSIIESLRPKPGQVETVLNKGEIIAVRGEHLRLVRITDLFGGASVHAAVTDQIAIVTEDMLGKRIALLVDEILDQQQVVIKNLGDGLGDIGGVAGGAIMSDGSVSLILDIGGIVKMAGELSDAEVTALTA
jgi:two-component system chemotaxis sensor kinase CheA